jgi:hypothetical protein
MSALKFWAAALAAVVAAVGPVLAHGPLDLTGQISALVAVAGAVYVYLQKNDDDGVYAYAKTMAHAVASIGVIVVSVLSGGISPMEWIQVGATVLGTLGVFGLKNSA